MTTFDDPMVYEANSHAMYARGENQLMGSVGVQLLGGALLVEAGIQLVKGNVIRAGMYGLGAVAARFIKNELHRRADANFELGNGYQDDAANLRRATVGLVSEY